MPSGGLVGRHGVWSSEEGDSRWDDKRVVVYQAGEDRLSGVMEDNTEKDEAEDG